MNNIFEFLTPKDSTFFIEADCTLRQALEKFCFHKFTVVPILKENGEYVGSVSEGDLLRHVKGVGKFDLDDAQDVDLMQIERYRSYQSINVTSSMEQVASLLLTQNFVPVVDDRGMFIGIIKRRAVMQYFVENFSVK